MVNSHPVSNRSRRYLLQELESKTSITNCMKNRYVALANQNFSNNFTGKGESMDTIVATANSFSADITNTGTVPVNIALIPGHYPTLGITNTGTDPVVSTVNFTNLSELQNAGITVQAIMDDGTQPVTGGTIVCNASDPAFTIRSFLEYIKTFDMVVSQVSLRSPAGNVAVYDNKLKLSRSNPFFRTEEIPVKTNQFFSVNQYQDFRIDISMMGTGLKLTKDLVMILTIPPNSTVGVDFYFAN